MERNRQVINLILMAWLCTIVIGCNSDTDIQEWQKIVVYDSQSTESDSRESIIQVIDNEQHVDVIRTLLSRAEFDKSTGICVFTYTMHVINGGTANNIIHLWICDDHIEFLKDDVRANEFVDENRYILTQEDSKLLRSILE